MVRFADCACVRAHAHAVGTWDQVESELGELENDEKAEFLASLGVDENTCGLKVCVGTSMDCPVKGCG